MSHLFKGYIHSDKLVPVQSRSLCRLKFKLNSSAHQMKKINDSDILLICNVGLWLDILLKMA